MTSSQRVQILSDNLEGMELLAQFLKNPRLVDDLRDEVIKLNKLTADETLQLNEAKKIIKDRDAIEAEIEALKVTLATAKDAQDALLAADRQEFEQYRSDVAGKLATDRTEVDRILADVKNQALLLDQREAVLNEKAEALKKLIEG